MKMLRTLSLLAAAALSLAMISSCQKDDSDMENASKSQVLKKMNQLNSSISIDGDIEFMILTPNGSAEVGFKSFTMSAKEDENYQELNGKSFFSLTTKGRYSDDIVSFMAYSQNLSKSEPGDKLNLERVSFGNLLSSDAEKCFGRFEDGDVYVKSNTDASITLRFVKIKGSNALGDFYFNGDLTFDIMK